VRDSKSYIVMEEVKETLSLPIGERAKATAKPVSRG
jgi:Lrp/AsnC family leucine-responsive transcriptional regulator